jgi:hypothetical protein
MLGGSLEDEEVGIPKCGQFQTQSDPNSIFPHVLNPSNHTSATQSPGGLQIPEVGWSDLTRLFAKR